MIQKKAKFPLTQKNGKLLTLLFGLALITAIPFVERSPFIISVITLIMIFTIYASSWNLLAFSGQGSLGHAAFLGIGAFTAALLSIKFGAPPLVGLVVGGLISSGVGFLVGATCVRLKAWFLAMVTFGFSVIAIAFFSQYDSITSAITGFPPPLLVSTGQFYFLALAVATISVASIYWIMKSKSGIALKAIHGNELEAKMSGINTTKYKLLAFVVSTFFAGIAGCLYVQNLGYVQVSIFSPELSFLPLMMSVIGGLGTIEGPIIGSIIVVFIRDMLPSVDPHLQSAVGSLFPAVSNVGPPLRLLGLGIFLLVVVIFLPNGIASLLRRGYNYFITDKEQVKN
jgi:branched-chain amino acid transport system permease protein